MQNGKDDDARHPASQNVDGIVSLDIDGGKTHQYKQRQHAIEQLPIATTPGQNHEDGSHTDMTAGESRCWSFARFVGTGHTLIEETFVVARYGKRLVVCDKVVADIGECAIRYVVESCGQVIILRTGDGQEDKDDVIDEERREDDEHRTVELLITAEEVEQRYKGNHREVRYIAQVHQLAEHGMRPCLCEEQRRLTTKKLLLVACKHVVEVGEDPVQQIGVGIPPRQEQHLCADTAEMGEVARNHAIHCPQCQRHHHDAEAPPKHGFRILHLRRGEEHQQQGQHQIAHDDPFHCQQSLARLLLYLKQKLKTIHYSLITIHSHSHL